MNGPLVRAAHTYSGMLLMASDSATIMTVYVTPAYKSPKTPLVVSDMVVFVVIDVLNHGAATTVKL